MFFLCRRVIHWPWTTAFTTSSRRNPCGMSYVTTVRRYGFNPKCHFPSRLTCPDTALPTPSALSSAGYPQRLSAATATPIEVAEEIGSPRTKSFSQMSLVSSTKCLKKKIWMPCFEVAQACSNSLQLPPYPPVSHLLQLSDLPDSPEQLNITLWIKRNCGGQKFWRHRTKQMTC